MDYTYTNGMNLWESLNKRQKGVSYCLFHEMAMSIVCVARDTDIWDLKCNKTIPHII